MTNFDKISHFQKNILLITVFYLTSCSHPPITITPGLLDHTNSATLGLAQAPRAGMMLNKIFNNCAPSRPIPLFEIHGTNDAINRYGGDRYILREKHLHGVNGNQDINTARKIWTFFAQFITD